MKVRELIEALSKLDGELSVCIRDELEESLAEVATVQTRIPRRSSADDNTHSAVG